MKRILEVISGLGMGGVERTFLDRLSRKPQDFDIKIINTRPELDNWTLPIGLDSQQNSRKSLTFFPKLVKFLLRWKPNIVITRSPADLILLAFARFFLRQEFDLIFEAHSTKLASSVFSGKIIRPFFKLAIKQTRLVIAASIAVAEGEQCEKAPRVKIHYFGSALAIMKPKDDHLNLLFCGRLVSLKRPLELVSIAKKLESQFRSKNAFLSFVGEGPLMQSLKDLVFKLDLVDIVRIHGYCDDLGSIYSHSHYLLCNSLYEGLPITFYEAKLSGLQIITTPVISDEIIFDSGDTILKSFDLEEMEQSISQVLELPKPSVLSRTQIQDSFSWMSSVNSIEKYYEILNSLN